MNRKKIFLQGLRDGLPIGAGYFAVAFSLGIAARKTGMSPLQGFVMSFLNHASAGEYAGISAMKSGTSYLGTALLILIANARYLLMSCALSQKISPKTSLLDRFLMGFSITDEIFGCSISYPGFTPPIYTYGTALTSIPFWASATAIGISAGNILPPMVVKALGAAIYGMFIAIIIPPAREKKEIRIVVIGSFLLSGIFAILPATATIPEGTKIILLTVLISVLAAAFMPIRDLEEAGENA